MSTIHETDYLVSLVHELRGFREETEWVELKHNNAEAERIGQYLSGLANSAALLGKANAYLVWGIDDQSHEVIGTDFQPRTSKVGNEELENWLLRLLQPKINHQSRRSIGRHGSLYRHAAEVAQRGPRVTDAPFPNL